MRFYTSWIALLALIPAVTAAPQAQTARCGNSFGGATCRGNPSASACCSRSGWCGGSDAHCLVSNGCQSAFGTCAGSASSSVRPVSSSVRPVSSSSVRLSSSTLAGTASRSSSAGSVSRPTSSSTRSSSRTSSSVRVSTSSVRATVSSSTIQSSSSAPAPGATIVNGGFESGNLLPWVRTIFNAETFVGPITDQNVESGRYAFKWEGRGGLTRGQIHQDLTLVAGTTYTVTLKLRDIANISPPDLMAVSISDRQLSAPLSKSCIIEIEPLPIWKTYTCNIPVEQSASRLFVYWSWRNSFTGAGVYIDNVSIKVAGTPDEPAINAVSNGGFESSSRFGWVQDVVQGPPNNNFISDIDAYAGSKSYRYVTNVGDVTMVDLRQNVALQAGHAYTFSIATKAIVHPPTYVSVAVYPATTPDGEAEEICKIYPSMSWWKIRCDVPARFASGGENSKLSIFAFWDFDTPAGAGVMFDDISLIAN